MKQQYYFLALSLTLMLVQSAQAESFNNFQEENRYITDAGISPNGKFIVGQDQVTIEYGNTYAGSLSSFLWDTEANTQTWLTFADVSQLEKSGCFNAVNDKGMIVGYYKNPENSISFTDLGQTATMPVNTAAIWIDGQVTSLGLGTDITIDDCKWFTDGTAAIAISNDGNIIVGNYTTNQRNYPCMWTKSAGSDEWSYQSIAVSVPEGNTLIDAQANDISENGEIIIGQVQYKPEDGTATTVPVYWKNGEQFIISPTAEDMEEVGSNGYSYSAAISPNGQYILVLFNQKIPAVYSVETGTYRKITVGTTYSKITGSDIDNNGNVVFNCSCGNVFAGTYTLSYWYSYSLNYLMDFSYFMKIFAPTVEPPFSFDEENKPQAAVRHISADGSMISGLNYILNPITGRAGSSSCWNLSIEMKDVEIPQAPSELAARLTGMNTVELSWVTEPSETLTLKEFIVYKDAVELTRIPTENGKTEYKQTLTDIESGHPQFTIASVYTMQSGEDIESPKSDIFKIAVPESFDMPLFENFDTGSLEANFWETHLDFEHPDMFNYWGVLQYMGLLDYATIVTYHESSAPYSLSLFSRPIDATEATERIHVSFAAAVSIYEDPDNECSKHNLAVEVSTDYGETWEEAGLINLSKMSSSFNFYSFDITELAVGNIFIVRFRANGEGSKMLGRLNMDNVSIAEESGEAPKDVIVCDNPDGTRLITWKNSNGAYELNYMDNPYNASGHTIGNEGREIIGANLYDQDFLAPFNGKYLSAVTTVFNWYDSSVSDPTGLIDAYIMVWENDQLVREQKINVPALNERFIAVLDEPLMIDAGKTLKVGIKIANYPAEELPLIYSNSMKYIDGVSNLYSEDNGETWSTLVKAFENSESPEDGFGSWQISANVTDTPETDNINEFSDEYFAYTIYRDGEIINTQMIYAMQGRYIETENLKDGGYQVRATYFLGGVSPLSETVQHEGSGVNTVNNDCPVAVYPNPVADVLCIEGEYESAILYDINGVEVARLNGEKQLNVTSLPAGIYMLSVRTAEESYTAKISVTK